MDAASYSEEVEGPVGRDPELLRRMYGGAASARPSVARPALWMVAATTGFVGSVGGAAALLWFAAAAGTSELERWGVIAPDEVELAVHHHEPDGGCVITGRRVVRWDERRPTGATTLAGASIVVEPGGVRIVGAGDVVCPFAAGEDPAPFVTMAARFAGR